MLKYRLISSLVIVPAILAAAFLAPGWILFLVILAFALLGTHEFLAFLEQAHIRPYKTLVMTGALLYLVGVYASLSVGMMFGPEEVGMSVLVFFVFGACLSAVFTVESGNPMHGLFSSMGALLYVPFLMGFFLLLLFDWPAGDGRLLLLYMLFVVKMTDVGAYFTGSAIGKTKISFRVETSLRFPLP